MENSNSNDINIKTPSRLRPPKVRANINCDMNTSEIPNTHPIPIEVKVDIDKTDGCQVNTQKRRHKSPRMAKEETNKLCLPMEIPQPSIIGDRMVKTYKTSAAATSRPIHVTKPMQKSGSKLLTNGKSIITRVTEGDSLRTAKKFTDNYPIRWGDKDKKNDRLEAMIKEMEILKAKMENSNQINFSANSKLTDAQNTIHHLEEEKCEILNRLKIKEGEIEKFEKEIKTLQQQHESEKMESENNYMGTMIKLQNELSEIVNQRDKSEIELNGIRIDLKNSSEQCDSLKAILSKQSSTLIENEAQVKALKTEIISLESNCLNKQLSIDSVKKKLEITEEQLGIATKKLRDGESLRRKLHNTIQELKGNIRVFCRIRPLLKNEISETDRTMEMENLLKHLNIIKNEEEQREEIKLMQIVESTFGNQNQNSKLYQFNFDKIFDWKSTQDEIFAEISQLIQSALDGYKVCIFAYGQTGSGKTFTMEGEVGDVQFAGIIPRTIQQIFESTENLKEKGWRFTLECSYLEIYNETIRDLLKPKIDDDEKYEIKHIDDKTMVTNLTIVTARQSSDIMNLLGKAIKNRSVGETQCNERSSRSHSVFTIQINGINDITMEKIEGILNLIDLAGSERLNQSKSTGDRLKETQAINKSLCSLGDVINSIANKEKHVPFRNSKLTYLLQNSLGGNCKTLMFVNINPSYESFNESICSLRFATKVNSCHIGTATKKMSK